MKNKRFKDTDKPQMESWDGFDSKSPWVIGASMAPATQCNKVATIIPSADIGWQLSLFRKYPFCRIWLLYKEAHTQNLSSTQFCKYMALILLYHLTYNSFRAKLKGHSEKNEVLYRERKRKMARKGITLSGIDKQDWWLQISLCVYWQKTACSSRLGLSQWKMKQG